MKFHFYDFEEMSCMIREQIYNYINRLHILHGNYECQNGYKIIHLRSRVT